MYQITFSEQSISEFNRLDKSSQLQFLDDLSKQCADYWRGSGSSVHQFSREGKYIYRCRVGELRVYFELNDSRDAIYCRYTLREHSFLDFIYRMKLPVKEEHIYEHTDSFWKYLESWLKKTN